jgi:hypothetical protein
MSTSASENTDRIPDAPGLSEEEIIKKLNLYKTLRQIGKTVAFAVIITGLWLFLKNTGKPMSLGEFFFAALLPAGAALLLFAMFFSWLNERSQALKKHIGSSVTLPVLREVFDVKAYHPDRSLRRETIEESKLHAVDQLSGSDYTEGSYRGVNFLFSDVCLIREETYSDDGKRKKRDVTDFKGQWLVCDFGKELSATVTLRERRDSSQILQYRNSKTSDIETENVEFNTKYQIRADDAHAAFYLLTPHFMEQLMALDELAHTQTLLSFRTGKVHIALNNWSDSFTVDSVKSGRMDEVRKKFRSDLRYLTGIMDALLENDKLLKKE